VHEELGSRGIFEAQTERRARRANLGEIGTDGRLARHEGGASSGATLLSIEIGEHGTLAMRLMFGVR
jgi:hypothetical protein